MPIRFFRIDFDNLKHYNVNAVLHFVCCRRGCYKASSYMIFQLDIVWSYFNLNHQPKPNPNLSTKIMSKHNFLKLKLTLNIDLYLNQTL